MPTPCYISITGQTQGNITAGAFTADSVGNIYVQGHEDEMLVQEFLHNVTVPTDPQSGQPAGQRAHKPFIFTVALNKAVPLMYNALASGEMLPTTELHWWRTSVEGKQEHYFTTRLTDSTIVDMKLHMPHCQDPAKREFRYDPVDRLTEQRGFDGRTQRYQYDLTGKLTQSEDEGLITLWHYDASDRITRRTVNGEPAEQWQYDDHGWLTEISHLSEGHRVAVHYGYDDKGRLTGERQTDGEDGPHPDGCDTDGRRADPPLPLRQPAPPGVPHADTAWRATGREPLPLRPAGTANGETGMAAGA